MAQGVWVADMIWHTMIVVGEGLVSFWRQWSLEILLGVSFGIQLVLSLFAGLRWRGASTVQRGVIWLAYVASSYVATTALGSLSISGSSGERQLVAFWAPFFLLHLGGPDNITAYEFEDNQLSMRSVLEMAVQIGGTVVLVYSCISGSWALMTAAWLMLFVCVTKHAERTLALHRANLGNMRRSLEGRHLRVDAESKKNGGEALRVDAESENGGEARVDPLLTAHALFHICKHAMVDSLVDQGRDDDESAATRRQLLKLHRNELLEVMEMELSLMYDFLYTKASVMYTWHGYGIRAISPLATLAALLLVELGSHGVLRHKRSDVVITRVLLAATFVQETASLLRTLGSSWTGFLTSKAIKAPGGGGQQYQLWWLRLRGALASVGLLANADDDYRHRRWSGNIGQYNLFRRLTCSSRPPLLGKEPDFWAGSVEHISNAAKYHVYMKVRHKVKQFRKALKKEKGAEEKVRLASRLGANRGKKTLKDYGLGDLGDSIGRELQVGILTWHIGTSIFLHVSQEAKVQDISCSRVPLLVEAIRVLSNYLMHLLVERPHMLPGLVTRQLLEQTRTDLAGFCDQIKKCSSTESQEQLARILHRGPGDDSSQLINTYLDRGIELGRSLVNEAKKGNRFFKTNDEAVKKGMVEVILEVWVDMLFYTSYRCSKESHAKQLAHGGELTTIVWLLAEHAGLFIVPKPTNKDDAKTFSEDIPPPRLQKKYIPPPRDPLSTFTNNLGGSSYYRGAA